MEPVGFKTCGMDLWVLIEVAAWVSYTAGIAFLAVCSRVAVSTCLMRGEDHVDITMHMGGESLTTVQQTSTHPPTHLTSQTPLSAWDVLC